ncbi:BOI-related E3 ubiquitin-protein ligase 1 isoform X1 [Nicotiana tabacum]|uniref:BOI-related E3 ubiquitin-protein ligase 1 isoform X1 n=1 Tax=Nicotiana tabacum TaxID=4097 RepID=A0A1S3X1E1_TOBAC|nr:PREDICTED: BOI-related E3 ubiquitin-protein ligase 1-like isoform X1 [Nicotiana tabacum]
MAVQVQYPSNVLLLNSVQERKNPLSNDEYSSQPQPGGASILDHTQMLFNPRAAGSNHSCKRRREITTNTTSTTAAAMNPLISSMQSQPQQQLIDLTQLHTHQPNVVSTGLRLASGQQLQQHQHQQKHHSRSPQSSQSSAFYSILTEDFSTIIKQQRDEIEHILHVQREQLRRTLEEKRRTHYRALLGTVEETMARQLKEKEAEVEKAVRRNAELEARAAQLSAEAQAWQARARAEEFTAATLQAQLQQAMINNGAGGCNAHLPESDGGEAEDAESVYVDLDRVVESTGPSCKACRKRVASVVLLPCRHLCVCTDCDAALQACPLCLSIRTSSVEVFLC